MLDVVGCSWILLDSARLDQGLTVSVRVNQVQLMRVPDLGFNVMVRELLLCAEIECIGETQLNFSFVNQWAFRLESPNTKVLSMSRDT